MRFGRIGPVGAEVPAVLDGDTWRDLRSVTNDIDGAFLSRYGDVDWAQVIGGRSGGCPRGHPREGGVHRSELP